MLYKILLALYKDAAKIPADNIARCPDAPYSALLAVYGDAGRIPPAVLAKCADAPNAAPVASILPPEVPVVEAAPEPAPAPKPAPAPAPKDIIEPDLTDSDAVTASIAALGWNDEQFQAMTDDVLKIVLTHAWRADAVDFDIVVNAESPVGYDIENVRLKPPAGPPRRRGRPPGSKNAPKATEPVVEAERVGGTDVQPSVVLTVEPVVEAAVVEVKNTVVEASADVTFQNPTPTVGTDDGFALYVNCYPERGVQNVIHLDAWLAPIMQMVAENNVDEKSGRKAPVPHYSVIPYGKGTSAVVAHVTGNVGMLRGASVVVDLRSPAASAVLEYLRPLASAVVVGRLS